MPAGQQGVGREEERTSRGTLGSAGGRRRIGTATLDKRVGTLREAGCMKAAETGLGFRVSRHLSCVLQDGHFFERASRWS